MSLLMEHNVPVYKEFCKCLEENHECILITATGTGKSYIVEEFLQQHNEVALVVVPRVSIKQSWEELSSNVSVVTYQWFMMHYRELIDQFVYVVFDEAHHISSGPWGKAVRKFKELSKSTYFIGLTADAIRYSDRNKDVANTEFHGHVVYGYNTSEAVEMGILPNARYVSALFNLPVLKKRLRQTAKNASDQNSDKIEKLFGRLDIAIKNYQSIQQILNYHLSKAGNRKGIVFVDSIKNIPNGVKIIKSAFKDQVLYIHSEMNRLEVSETIKIFKKMKHGYIVTVDMLNEGVHIDGVNTIIMLRKTKSPAVYKQQIGRALSSTNPNELVYVFDFVGNASEIMDYYNSSYRNTEDKIDESVSIIMREIESKYPKISNQFIIDDSTKEILSIINQIQKYSKRRIVHRYTEKELIAILSSCNSYEEAVERTGYSYSHIGKLAKKFGLVDKLSITAKRKIDEDHIISVLTESSTTKEVERKLGISYNRAFNLINKYGFADKFIRVKNTEIHRFSDDDIAIMREMAEIPFKYSVDDVVNRLGISRRSVLSKLNKLKLNDKFLNKKTTYDCDALKEIIDICETSKTKREASLRLHQKFPGMDYRTKKRYLLMYNQDAIKINQQMKQLDDVVKKYYQSEGPTKVAELLPNLSMGIIKARASKLGIIYDCKFNFRMPKKYSDIIDRFYPIYGSSIVEKFGLPLTKSQVFVYVRRHDIKRITPDLTDPKFISFMKESMDESIEFVSQMVLINFGFSISKNTINEIRRKIRKEEAQ